jgi:L-2-hydroxyglutarate oxidase LhgO
MSGRTADYLVVGGGIVGLSIATALRRRYPDCSVVLLEKEPECGRHASGRNSGVLHAGFYYTADSLKARFSRDGNRELTEYCLENGLRIHRCGKLVVARSADELDSLRELFRRAGLNGVPVERVGEEEAARLEPEARTCREALYSPTTATVDPPEVVRALARDAARLGVEIRTGTSFEGRERDRVLTSSGTLSVGYVINAAGLYADRVARQFGFAEDPAVSRSLYSLRGRWFGAAHAHLPGSTAGSSLPGRALDYHGGRWDDDWPHGHPSAVAGALPRVEGFSLQRVGGNRGQRSRSLDP